MMSFFNLEFIKDVIKKSPATTFLITLLIISFSGCYIWGDGASDLNTARLFGAITPFDATTDELIRTITSTFQQIGGPIHLLLNLSAIVVTGPFLERIYGPVKYTAFFLITGVFGSLFTLMFSDLNVISAGASGSGYGLMGLYLGLVLKKDPLIDTTTKNWVWNMIWINLVWTFFIPGISITGHMGGLISGVIIASLFNTQPQFISNWFSNIIKSIITFSCVVICIQVPQMIWPNTTLPYIQEIREKVGLETIYEVSNPFSNELFYSLTETNVQQNQPLNLNGKISSEFIKGNFIELLVIILLVLIIWRTAQAFFISSAIKKLIKSNSKFSLAKEHQAEYLLNQIGNDALKIYTKSHPKINKKRLFKITEFELQLLFGTMLQKVRNVLIKAIQIVILLFSTLMVAIFISIVNSNEIIPENIQDQITLSKQETATKNTENSGEPAKSIMINNEKNSKSNIESTEDLLNSIFIFGYENVQLQSVFNNTRFSDLDIIHKANRLFISGYYNGALVSSKDPYLEIIFTQQNGQAYTTESVIYNGQILGNLGTYNVVDILLTGRQSYGEMEIFHSEEDVMNFLFMNNYVPDGYTLMSHGTEGNDYVIQIYEDMGTHTATLNWYYINKYTLDVIEMF